jgi:hypothetical protein
MAYLVMWSPLDSKSSLRHGNPRLPTKRRGWEHSPLHARSPNRAPESDTRGGRDAHASRRFVLSLCTDTGINIPSLILPLPVAAPVSRAPAECDPHHATRQGHMPARWARHQRSPDAGAKAPGIDITRGRLRTIGFSMPMWVMQSLMCAHGTFPCAWPAHGIL